MSLEPHLKFTQPKRKCPKCGFEIPGNLEAAGREYKPGRARIACENCARGVKPAKGRYTLKGEQQTIEGPPIKID